MKNIFSVMFAVFFLFSANAYSSDSTRQYREQEDKALSEITIGSHITFGNYPFEADGRKKPIEWIVLEKYDDETVLMITRYSVDKAKFHNKQKPVKWNGSTIRSWLNGKFLNTAFSKKERRVIRTVSNVNDDNKKYRTRGSWNTSDKVFLLSIDEAKKFFDSDGSRRAYPTPYTTRDTIYSGTSWQWLRSPGSEPDSSAIISDMGDVDDIGYFVSHTGNVRPVIRTRIRYLLRIKIRDEQRKK